MSENVGKTVLKIRFVLLGDAIVMQVLEQDNKTLGLQRISDAAVYENLCFTASNEFQIATQDEPELFGKIMYLSRNSTGFDDVVVQNNTNILASWSFHNLKQALAEFAENNAFHGKDKPLPRMQIKDRDNCVLITPDGDEIVFHEQTLRQLDILYGKKVPIYEDKPKFSSEWRRVYPIFDATDIATPIPQSLMEALAETEGVINAQLERNSEIEIHEFTMRAI